MPGQSRKRKDGFRPFHIITKIIQAIISLVMGLAGLLAGLLKLFLGLSAAAVIVCAIAGTILYIRLKPEIDVCMQKAYDITASMQEGDFLRGQDTYVYDSEGNTVGIINAGHFEYVDISHISTNLQDLYISQEDKRFKEHHGVDLIATFRAGLSLLKHNGEVTQGGSTITQQVVKNIYLTQEQTFERKAIEILVAPQLEQKFTKAKVMEFYCNSNYYGNRCYGVQAASRYYFGKDASGLSIAQAALLVGISNSPSAYDPVAHPDAALEKRDEVIRNGLTNGVLTEEQANAALVIVQEPFEENMETWQSTYALHCAALALMEKDGFPFQYTFADKEEYDSYMESYDRLYDEKTEEVRSGGYEIYTSFRPDAQQVLQEAVDSTLAFSTETQENGKYAMQGAAVLLDNQTGYVIAIVGGRGTDDEFNRAYLSARQPGSSIKPLIDYVPAMETGEYSPGTIVNDHLFDNGPKNSGGTYYGEVTL